MDVMEEECKRLKDIILNGGDRSGVLNNTTVETSHTNLSVVESSFAQQVQQLEEFVKVRCF